MKQNHVLLSGGGTAGHIIPSLHVARELKNQNPQAVIWYVIEKNSQFLHLVEEDSSIDEIVEISCGKWRRYHDVTFFQKLIDVETNWRNFRDVFKTLRGIWQMFGVFRSFQPSIVFCKGGFVSVPVGIVARLRRTPLITHDSDSTPGLANRIISRWAIIRTVANEETAQAYSNVRTKVVGIPIDPRYEKTYTTTEKRKIRQNFGLKENQDVVVVVGGSLGADKLNQALKQSLASLINDHPSLYVYWVSGEGNVEDVSGWLSHQAKEVQSQIRVEPFSKVLPEWSAIAKVILSRGGATAIAEIVATQVPAVIVPAGFLPGGHQTENAHSLAHLSQIRVVTESDDSLVYAESIVSALKDFLKDKPQQRPKASKASIDKPAETISALLLKNMRNKNEA